MELHQLAFAGAAYAVPAAFFAAVGAGMLYGIIRHSALSLGNLEKPQCPAEV